MGAWPGAALERIAEQPGVRQWVWAEDGPATSGRGDGPAPERIADQVRSVVRLLSSHGRVASLHVHHGSGHVLVGVAPAGSLVVAGGENLNLGAIHSAFRALEEEP